MLEIATNSGSNYCFHKQLFLEKDQQRDLMALEPDANKKVELLLEVYQPLGLLLHSFKFLENYEGSANKKVENIAKHTLDFF